MPPLTIEDVEAELTQLARYVRTSNYVEVQDKVNRLLDTWLLLNRDAYTAEWDCEPVGKKR
jgi:hypothetical protein